MGKAKAKGASAPSDGKTHSKIGASSMYRWSACPGSVRICEGIESAQSPWAEEGTKAHELAEMILARELYGKKLTRDQDNAWMDAPNDMKDAVSVYTEFVLDRSQGASETHIEHPFDLSSLFPGLYGTADCVVYDAKKKHLLVGDYKHGAGISVSAEQNTQLMYYALGALLTLGYPCKSVEVAIIQPRCPHPQGMIRTWTLSVVDLLEFAADLVEFAKATEKPHAPLNSGEHCRFCPAAGICPELGKTALQVAQSEFTTMNGSGKNVSYDPKKLAQALAMVEQVEGYCKSVREFAYREALQGRTPPGYKLVQKRGSRHWALTDSYVEQVLMKRGLSRLDIYEEPALKSPAQIEKMISGQKNRDEIIAPLVKTVSSGVTLVSEDDPRPSVVTDAAEDFKQIEG